LNAVSVRDNNFDDAIGLENNIGRYHNLIIRRKTLASHSTNNVQGAQHNTINVNVNNTFGGDRTSHSLHLNDESLQRGLLSRGQT
jgi:hypothetical protein